MQRLYKIIPAIYTSQFAVYFAFIQLPQPATPPSFRRNLPQIATHILQKAFFKHTLNIPFCPEKQEHGKNESQVPMVRIPFAFIQLTQPATPSSFRQNLPQIVTYILQKAFFKHALELLPCYDERFVIFDKVINVICSKIEGDRWPNLF